MDHSFRCAAMRKSIPEIPTGKVDLRFPWRENAAVGKRTEKRSMRAPATRWERRSGQQTNAGLEKHISPNRAHPDRGRASVSRLAMTGGQSLPDGFAMIPEGVLKQQQAGRNNLPAHSCQAVTVRASFFAMIIKNTARAGVLSEARLAVVCCRRRAPALA